MVTVLARSNGHVLEELHDAGGAELTRIGGPAGSSIPLDNPAGVAFDDARRSLLVANHTIFGDPAHFAALRIFVDDREAD